MSKANVIEGSIAMSQRDWDDTMLMDIFKETLSSHRTAGQGSSKDTRDKNNRRKTEVDREREKREATPGDWEPVVEVEIGPDAEHSSSGSILNELDSQNDGLSASPLAADDDDDDDAAVGSSLDAQIQDAHAVMLHAYYQMGLATGRYEALIQVRERRQAEERASVGEAPVDATAPQS